MICPRMHNGRGRMKLVVCVVLFSTGVAVSSARAQDPPPRISPIVIDVHAMLPRFPQDEQLAFSRGLQLGDLPGRRSRDRSRRSSQFLQWRAITFGIGGEVVTAARAAEPSRRGGAAVMRRRRRVHEARSRRSCRSILEPVTGGVTSAAGSDGPSGRSSRKGRGRLVRRQGAAEDDQLRRRRALVFPKASRLQLRCPLPRDQPGTASRWLPTKSPHDVHGDWSRRVGEVEDHDHDPTHDPRPTTHDPRPTTHDRTTNSLPPHRHHRIHSRRAAGGEIAGEQGDAEQRRRDPDKRERIRRAHFEQQPRISRAPAARRPNPSATPASASRQPSPSTMRTTSAGFAPTAMRTPISWVRCETE